MEIVVNTVALLINLVFLYFTTPYLAGKGLHEVTTNSVWRRVSYALSWPGVLCYRGVERTYRWLRDHIGRRWSSHFARFVNLLLYFGALYVASMLWDWVAVVLLDLSEDLEVLDWKSRVGLVQNGLVLFSLISGSGAGFTGAIGRSLSYCAKYVIYYTFRYSMLFGLLEAKMFDLNILSKHNVHQCDWEPAPLSVTELIGNCLNGLYDFVDDLAVMLQLRDPKTSVWVMLLCTACGAYLSYVGKSFKASELVMEIVDASGVVGIITSFLFVVLVHLLVQLAIFLLLRLMPHSIQQFYRHTCEKAEEGFRRAKERRASWSRQHDEFCNSHTVGWVHNLRLD